MVLSTGDMSRKLPIEFSFPDGLAAVETADGKAMRIAAQRVWLDAFPSRGWRAACEAAGVDSDAPIRWARTDPQFAAAREAASAETADRLTVIADEIATGEREATPTQASMLQFRLRALRPDLYRERASVTLAAAASGESGSAGRARLLLAEWSAD